MNEQTTPSLQEMSLLTLEKAVVCGLLVSPVSLPEVTGWLRPEMFKHPDMGFIYSAVYNLYDRGIRPDYLATEAEMRRMDNARTDQLGGIVMLERMLEQVRHEANAPLYAAEIKRQYLLRRLWSACTETAGKALLIESDPLDLAAQAEAVFLQLRELGQPAHTLHDMGTLATEAVDMHQEKLEKGIESSRVLTGLTEFDAVFGGMQNGELFIAGGRPGDGKTAVTLHMAIQAALRGKHTWYYSMEMGNQQMMNRIFAGYAGIRAEHLRTSHLSEEELEKMRTFTKEWEKVPLYFDYTPANTLENIRASVMLRVRQERCDFAVLDQLQLMRTERRKNETDDQYIGRIIIALKALALEANIPILVISQLNRDSEKRSDKWYMPILSDLRASGAIEQAADGVFIIYRPERHGIQNHPKTGEDLRSVLLLLALKHRNSRSGMARVRHNSSFTFFTDYDNTLF
ncbi:MAG: AAA family ATPase [Tannerellaceae bacterium]|nr:AAA family ATPase [Tannerellaceae bacterium]